MVTDLKVQILKTRPLVVEAVQVTSENRRDLALWCDGLPMNGGVAVMDAHRDFRVAQLGDWVIKDAFGEYVPIPDTKIFGRYEGVVAVHSE